jgi:magnesium-transporting ATPase (P-type)
MTTVNRISGRKISYTKGAPESIFNICNKELRSGNELELTNTRKQELLDLTEDLSRTGYRTLGFAYSPEGNIERDMNCRN